MPTFKIKTTIEIELNFEAENEAQAIERAIDFRSNVFTDHAFENLEDYEDEIADTLNGGWSISCPKPEVL